MKQKLRTPPPPPPKKKKQKKKKKQQLLETKHSFHNAEDYTKLIFSIQ